MTERVRRLKTDIMQHDFYQTRNRVTADASSVPRSNTYGQIITISAFQAMIAKLTAAAQLFISSDTSDSPSGDKISAESSWQ
jgi:hypothetical protein